MIHSLLLLAFQSSGNITSTYISCAEVGKLLTPHFQYEINAEEVGNTIRSLRFYRWSMAGLCMGNCEQSIYYADHSVCENEDPVASTIILVFAAFLFGFQVNEFLEPIKSTPINLEP